MNKNPQTKATATQIQHAHEVALEFASQCLATRLKQCYGEGVVKEDGVSIVSAPDYIELGIHHASNGDFYMKCYMDARYDVLRHMDVTEF